MEEEEDSRDAKSLADQYKEDLASGKTKGTRELPKLARRNDEGDEVDLDTIRLRRALDDEKKRKNMGEDEA